MLNLALENASIVLADADTEALSAATFGITTQSITDGTEGFVTTFGVVRGIDTSAIAAGAPIYPSSTAGGFTATRPTAPAHTVFLGWVIKSHASSGEIFVNISNGWELDELHNVYINPSTQANNDALIYDSATSLWKNQALKTINSNSLIGSGNIVTTYIRRHETTSTYDYLGFALSGTAESTATWTLTRLTLSSSGISAVMHATDSWTNRTTAVYS